MFRQEEVFIGGWQDRTIEAMLRRRFDQGVAHLQPLGAARITELSGAALSRRIEQSWQSIERKPLRGQQIRQMEKSVLDSIEQHADSLSSDEHDLVERALVLGGCVQIEDIYELEAARALCRRLWASCGLVSGRPYVELMPSIIRPAAKAFVRREHLAVRKRLQDVGAFLKSMIYRDGLIDDHDPQRLILREALHADGHHNLLAHLARRHLWSSYDCVDYGSGVMLVHPALFDPARMISSKRKRRIISLAKEPYYQQDFLSEDILPEEVPLQRALERSMQGALREGMRAEDTARNIRFLCKQGAPLFALEEVLQASLIVCISPPMRSALTQMNNQIPKWMHGAERVALQ